ncbi:MAG: glycine oxidase ThiO [Nitrosomonas sp.]|nr:glycine oxidase ThiO [Nitrosomonas sp.]
MKQDVIVIGAGIIGLATAEQLLLQGAKVTILERNTAGQESSWAGGGILSPLCPWDYSDEVTQLTSYSASLFPTWCSVLHQETGIDPEYDVSGMLILPPFDQKAALLWCSRREVKIKCCATPALESNNINVEGLLLPDIAQVRNPRLLQALRQRIMQLGGNLIEHCAVTDVKFMARRAQSSISSYGEFFADHFVICAGAWSPEILKNHAPELNIRPIKGQMLLFKFEQPPLPKILAQNGVYLIPRRDGHLLVGSTLEDVGFDKRTTVSARECLLARAYPILPALRTMPIIQQWSGLRPASIDNVPTIGKHPIITNVLINAGHFRYGVTMAPASAKILVNEITGAKQPLDIAPYQVGSHSAVFRDFLKP